jgi:effector-binding domain-containing protein
MKIEIITTPLNLQIYGFGDTAINKDYSGTAFAPSGKMWQLVKANNIKNKGKNIWVYEPAHQVFAGIEVEDVNDINNSGLQQKSIGLNKYAYYKHVGPYRLIKEAGQNMTAQLKEQGLEVVLPYIEIYGHWTGDENTSETELLMTLAG